MARSRLRDSAVIGLGAAPDTVALLRHVKRAKLVASLKVFQRGVGITFEDIACFALENSPPREENFDPRG